MSNNAPKPLLDDKNRLAAAITLLMLVPALPIPTGGISHVTELITIIIAVQLAIGRQQIWLPRKLDKYLDRHLNDPRLNRQFEKYILKLQPYAPPKMTHILESKAGMMVIGIGIQVLAIAAFISPPFSGLDTLPSLGAVLLASSLILQNVYVALAGLVIGISGITLEIFIAKSLLNYFHL